MSTLRLLFIEPAAERRVGGIETALAGWSAALKAAGVDVTRAETASRAEIAAADVVHFHGLWERHHAALRALCRSLNKPYLVSPHGMLEPWAFAHKGWKKLPYFHLREKPALNRSAAIVATSRAEALNLERWFGAGRIKVIPLGLQETPGPDYAAARERLGWAADERVVVFLSRLHTKKGLHVLIAAWERIVTRAGEPVRLVVVGDGEADYVEPLRGQAERCGGRVDWIGPQWGEAKWPWLQGADVFCLPTFSENFGLVVPEALLVGTPVVTTPGTPWGELARGLPVTICEPAVDELAAALLGVLAQPRPDAARRAKTHAEVVARFGWSRLAKDYVALYLSVAAKAR